MFISKTPFRVPLAGGGTDLSFYYKKRGGEFLTCSFNQFVYVYASFRKFNKNSLIQTTNVEFVKNNKKIKHDLIRETLKEFKIKQKIHIGSFSTIPTKTGLGSSSSFVVGLITVLLKLLNQKMTKNQIYKKAYKIEREILNNAGGWQDQIIATYGGIQKVTINKKGQIKINELKLKKQSITALEKKALLVFTDETRDSAKIINEQIKNKKKIFNIYDKIKSKVNDFENLLKKKKIEKIGELLHDHWFLKRKLTKNISNSYLDNFYFKLMNTNLFYGGKLIGAGGGGFFLLISKNKKKAQKYLKLNKIDYTDFKIEKKGSKIIEGF